MLYTHKPEISLLNCHFLLKKFLIYLLEKRLFDIMISTNISTSTIDVTLQYMYVVEGFLITTLNLIFVLFILLSRKLRLQKEYIIYTGTMTYDAIFGLGYFASGIQRLNLYYTEKCNKILNYLLYPQIVF